MLTINQDQMVPRKVMVKLQLIKVHIPILIISIWICFFIHKFFYITDPPNYEEAMYLDVMGGNQFKPLYPVFT